MPTMFIPEANLIVMLVSLAGAPAGASDAARPPTSASTHASLTLAQGAPVMRGRPPAPPPAPPVERVAPRRGYIWVEGNYEWRDGRYAWTGGHWEAERPGQRWHGGHWDWQGDRYVWVRGEWLGGPVYTPPPRYVVETPPPPPPPPQAAPRIPPARPGFVWIPGNNEWRDGRYVWVDGHWEKERRGERWQSGHWDREGDRHAWHPGEWRREGDGRDGDGDRRDGDRRDGDRRDGDRHDRDRRDDEGRPHGRRDQGPGPGGPASITGRVLGPNGAPVPGITVILAGTSEGRAVTDGGGNYAFTGLSYGSYAVRPNTPGCSFSPDVMNLNNLSWGAVQNFRTSCGRR
jgi:hypothetical protein